MTGNSYYMNTAIIFLLLLNYVYFSKLNFVNSFSDQVDRSSYLQSQYRLYDEMCLIYIIHLSLIPVVS